MQVSAADFSGLVWWFQVNADECSDSPETTSNSAEITSFHDGICFCI